MTRRKINLAYIRNDSMRKATFNKRKKGFFKKLNEISVLCGIEACAVIYNPYSSNPEVWPSSLGVKNVVDKFEMMPEMEQEKKMVSHESFLEQSITKIMENNKKKMKENEEKTMKEVMFLLLRGNDETLQMTNQNREDLCKYIDQYLKELYHHRETLNQSQFQFGESSSATNVVAPTSMLEMGSSVPTNDFWSLGNSIISSQAPEHANAISSNFGPSFVGQQEYYPVGGYDQNPNLSHSSNNQYQHHHFGYPNLVQYRIYNPSHQTHNQHQFGYPIVAQDGVYNQVQAQNQQEGWVNPLEMSFLPMDANNYYQFHHQP